MQTDVEAGTKSDASVALDERREELERMKKEQQTASRKSIMMAVSFFIVTLSFVFSFDWSTSPPRFNFVILIFGILFVILIIAVYTAAVDRSRHGERAEKASQRSQVVLDSINDNLAKLGHLDERMTQLESRMRLLEESRPPPPPSI